jgi:hypothetical protein
LSRKYNKNIVNSAIFKGKILNRSDILDRRYSKKNDRVFLALTFNPELPSVTKIIKKFG